MPAPLRCAAVLDLNVEGLALRQAARQLEWLVGSHKIVTKLIGPLVDGDFINRTLVTETRRFIEFKVNIERGWGPVDVPILIIAR